VAKILYQASMLVVIDVDDDEDALFEKEAELQELHPLDVLTGFTDLDEVQMSTSMEILSDDGEPI
jgi:hypothetical protein